MNHYCVTWNIDIEAETPRDAAKQALKIQRDPESIATVFKVKDQFGQETLVDLEPEEIAEPGLDLIESATMLLDRLDHHGSIDPVREEGPIEDLRRAISKVKGGRKP